MLINETVSVNFLTNHLKQTALPTSFYWHGRKYYPHQLGLHYTTREGRTLFHIFTVTDGINCFKLELNTETLKWKLLEIYVFTS